MTVPVDNSASVLVLFPSSHSASEIEAGVEEVQEAFTRHGSVPVKLTDSLTWYKQQFSAAGNWDSWALETVAGKSYFDRQPHFAGFVYSGPDEVGLGTGKILSLSLAYGKPVYRYLDGALALVEEVVQDGSSWKITVQEKGGPRA